MPLGEAHQKRDHFSVRCVSLGVIESAQGEFKREEGERQVTACRAPAPVVSLKFSAIETRAERLLFPIIRKS